LFCTADVPLASVRFAARTEIVSTQSPATTQPKKQPSVCRLFVGFFAATVAAATIASTLGDWHWLLDLASHFCCYYIGAAITGILIAWKLRRWVSLGVLSIALLWNGIQIAPFYIPASQGKVPDGAMPISIISLNVLTRNADKAAVIKYLRDRQPDLIIVMEIDSNWSMALEALAEIYPYRLLEPRPDNFGIGLLSKLPLKQPRIIRIGSELPSVVSKLDPGGKEFLLVGTHPVPPVSAAATESRNTQLRAVADFVKESTLPALVAGDLNATPWSTGYRRFASTSGLRDTALGRGVQVSWNTESRWFRIPIDHIFVPRDSVVISRTIGPNVGSDHFPVEATMVLP
jgi:endonuclease/exonuclease/phosphatase (EEP) superfamily protein YafD